MTDVYNVTPDRDAHNWMDRGKCHDSRVHFPEGTLLARQRMAQEAADICATCPFDVQEKCFEFALEGPEKNGVWSGTNFQRDPAGQQSFPKSVLRKRRAAFVKNLPAARAEARLAGREARAEIAGGV